MERKKKWYDSPLYNWAGTAVSSVMLAVVIQRFMSPEPKAGTRFDLAIWSLMFVTFSGTAIYKTWFRS